MQTPHWTQQYIGLPYEKGGEGPDAFNCWVFFRHVQLRQFGRDVPPVAEPEKLRAIARLFRVRREDFGWVEVANRQRRTGDAVLMAHANHPSHIGTWVDGFGAGAVLHSVGGTGSVCTPVSNLETARWKLVAYYRPAAED